MGMMDNINWSFSKLAMYESCPLQFKLRYIEKLPEPPRPPDNPLERGNRIHDNLEKFVKSEGTLRDNEARKIVEFTPALEHLQQLYLEGKAVAEDNWWFSRDWDPCDRKHVWLWSKLDFNVHDETNGHTIVGDYKSGKSGYKTVDHIQQIQLYSAVAALRQDWADTITAELWYVDEGWVRSSTYTREEALKFVGRFDARAQRIYNDRFFKHNANKVTCRFCPFSPRGTGACPVGV